MSVHVSSLVWKLHCSPAMKIVLLKLADHAKDDGSDVYPSQKTVAAECGVSDRTVRNVIRFAIEQGWLIEEATPGNRQNYYIFDLNAISGGTWFQVERGSRWNVVPTRRNVVPTRRNVVPPINKNHHITIIQPSVICDENLDDDVLPASGPSWWESEPDERLRAIGEAFAVCMEDGKPAYDPPPSRDKCEALAQYVREFDPGGDEVKELLESWKEQHNGQRRSTTVKRTAHNLPYRNGSSAYNSLKTQWFGRTEAKWRVLKRERERSNAQWPSNANLDELLDKLKSEAGKRTP